MNVKTRRSIVGALLWLGSCLSSHRSLAFQAHGARVRRASAMPPRRGGARAAARAGDDGERDDNLLSRRAALRRTAYGAVLAATAVAPANAAPVAAASEKDWAASLPAPGKKLGLAPKIRAVSHIMDELQRDLMQERWDLVAAYPNQLRSYVPVFTAYSATVTYDSRLRAALRQEMGRYFVALERFRTAAARRSLDEASVAYADMAYRLDRYLVAGGLYRAYDDGVVRALYAGNNSDPKKDPARIRDQVVLVKGPEVGRTGIVVGVYPDEIGTCAVKLDRSRGVREMRVVDRSWVGRRKGEQEPDEAFLIPESG